MSDGEEERGDASENAAAAEAAPAEDDGVPTAEPEEQPRAFKIVHPREHRPRRAREPRTVFHLNVLAGLMGLMSLMFTWVYEPYYSRYEVFGAFRYLVDMGEYSSLYAAIVLLIVIGSILCFVTSLGGLFLLGGVLLYAYGLVDDPSMAGPGPFVAVAATFLGMASLLLPSKVRVPARLATLVPSERGGLSVNALALSAFALGLLSAVMCWVVIEQWTYSGRPLDDIEFTLLSFLFENYVSELSLMVAGASLVCVGSVACLITPLGCILQVAGTAMVYAGTGSTFADVHSYWGTTEIRFAAGLYVAIIASLAGVWSMVFVRRVRVPARFVPGMSSSEATEQGAVPLDDAAREEGPPRSGLSAVLVRIPKMARVPAAAAITLALAVLAASIPYAVPLSTVGLQVVNTSVDDVVVDVYLDGGKVATGSASASYGYIWEGSVRAGIHSLSLDYAFYGSEDPYPDGTLDWFDSVEVEAYGKSYVIVALSSNRSIDTFAVELSCSPTASGYDLTFEEILRYGTFMDSPEEISWSDLSLVIARDSDAGVGWSFVSSYLEGSYYMSYDFGTQHLDGLALNCTAFDMSGDGEAGVGDFLSLSVVEGEFSESSEYVAYLLYEPEDYVVGEVTLSS